MATALAFFEHEPSAPVVRENRVRPGVLPRLQNGTGREAFGRCGGYASGLFQS